MIVHSIYLEVLGYIFLKKIMYFCLKIIFTLTNSVDPDEMMRHFIWFFTVSKSTHLVSPIQRVKVIHLLSLSTIVI